MNRLTRTVFLTAGDRVRFRRNDGPFDFGTIILASQNGVSLAIAPDEGKVKLSNGFSMVHLLLIVDYSAGTARDTTGTEWDIGLCLPAH
jgi:hypothetical protein